MALSTFISTLATIFHSNTNNMNFYSEGLAVDYISLSLENISQTNEILKIAFHFSRALKFNFYFKYNQKIKSQHFDFKQEYNFLIEKYDSKFNWSGILIKFSGNNAKQFYKLLKRNKVNWNIFKNYSVSLNRFDLCYFRRNQFSQTSFDEFLLEARKQIQTSTNTRHISLKDSPDGKILKVNRRSNALHYRVYQKNDGVQFELEIKKRKTKSVHSFLFR